MSLFLRSRGGGFDSRIRDLRDHPKLEKETKRTKRLTSASSSPTKEVMYPLSCLISSAISSLDMVSGSAGCVSSSEALSSSSPPFATFLAFLAAAALCAVGNALKSQKKLSNHHHHLISPRRVETTTKQRTVYTARRISRPRTSPSTPTRRCRDRTRRSSATRSMEDSFSNHHRIIFTLGQESRAFHVVDGNVIR